MDAAWHPDPGGRHELRYWDGSSWTDHVSDHGVTSLDPLPPYPGASPEADPAADTGAAAGGHGAHAADQGGHESQSSPVADLSSEPTRFAPGGALPSYDQPSYDQPSSDQSSFGRPEQEQAPAAEQPSAYEPWSPQAADPAEPAEPSEPAEAVADPESHEAETLQPSSEPIFASMGEGKPDLEPEPAPAWGAEPVADPTPEGDADPDAWVRGLLADGEQLVDSVRGDEREVTVTSHRVIVREHAGGWTAFRLDRVSHVDVIGDGTGREAVQVHVAHGSSHRVTADTEQAAALVRALTT